jgi:hypothetical protein
MTSLAEVRAYFAITATLFGVLAVLHFWRIIAEWGSLAADPWYLSGIAGIGVIAAGLSAWALRLLMRPGQHG